MNVLGVGISVLNMDTARAAVRAALTKKQRGYICVTGVHGVMEAQSDDSMRRILNRSFLTTPDGMPMVWLGRLHGHSSMRRVYGPDLMLAACADSVASGHTHFLYGGAEGVAEELKRALEKAAPGIRIVGTYTPPFRPLSPVEDQDLLARIGDLAPDIIWVGLSTPKQEKFMAANIDRFPTTLMFGVGAAFDFHTGRVKQAPSWMQRAGLEWLYRVLAEPKRLWRRYARNNPAFIIRILGQLLGLRRYTLDDSEIREP